MPSRKLSAFIQVYMHAVTYYTETVFKKVWNFVVYFEIKVPKKYLHTIKIEKSPFSK